MREAWHCFGFRGKDENWDPFARLAGSGRVLSAWRRVPVCVQNYLHRYVAILLDITRQPGAGADVGIEAGVHPVRRGKGGQAVCLTKLLADW